LKKWSKLPSGWPPRSRRFIKEGGFQDFEVGCFTPW
jgi:hypothetical protein